MEPESTPRKPWYKKHVGPLTTEGRVWLFIISLYLAAFCISTFVYWNDLALKVVGVFSAAAGLFLFVASFFNTEGHDEKSHHPLIWYVRHIIIMLVLLFVIRFTSGLVTNPILGAFIIYGGLLSVFVFFRKELLQLMATLVVLLFLFVTSTNWTDIVIGGTTFKDSIDKCKVALFKIGPIHDLSNLVVTGNYLGYLSRIEYRNAEINIKASNIIHGSHDDEELKAELILNYVSNEIEYISDPQDGLEYPKDPLVTLSARGGDCEDQTMLLCSMLETVGVKSYIAFTREHVFAVVQFHKPFRNPETKPIIYIDGLPCYALDPSRPEAKIGDCTAEAHEVERVFDVRVKEPVDFSFRQPENI